MLGFYMLDISGVNNILKNCFKCFFYLHFFDFVVKNAGFCLFVI